MSSSSRIAGTSGNRLHTQTDSPAAATGAPESTRNAIETLTSRPDAFLALIEELAVAGYRQYEISNFALPGFESRHNSKYWRLEPVYAFGVSAHSFDGSERYANERDTSRYVEKIESEGTAEVMREEIDLASEYAFLGLRLAEGIDLDDYLRKFGFDIEEKYRSELKQAKDNGLVEAKAGHLLLTERGKVFSNEVFSIFV